jgi:hypothetical protein
MEWSALFVVILCQGNPPARELDPQNPHSLTEHAVYNTRSRKSYETRFKARLAVPNSAPLDYDGECVWVSPAVLYVHYTASGGDDKKIVRAGDEAWVYHSLVGWVTDDEAGMTGAGRGIQNPDELLSVLARHSGSAKLRQPGVVEILLSGDAIESIMKGQVQQGSFDWKGSNATIELTVDGQNQIRKFTCDATLKSANPQVSGLVKYTGQVDLTDTDKAVELTFHDEKKKVIPLDNPIQEAIHKVLKEKK